MKPPEPGTRNQEPRTEGADFWRTFFEFAGRAIDPGSPEQLLGLAWELAPRLAAAAADCPSAAVFRRSFWMAAVAAAERGDAANLRDLVAEAVRRVSDGFPTPAELRRRDGYRRPAWLDGSAIGTTAVPKAESRKPHEVAP